MRPDVLNIAVSMYVLLLLESNLAMFGQKQSCKEQRAPLLYTTVLSSTGLVYDTIEADTLDEQNTGFYFVDIYQKMSNNGEKPFYQTWENN